MHHPWRGLLYGSPDNYYKEDLGLYTFVKHRLRASDDTKQILDISNVIHGGLIQFCPFHGSRSMGHGPLFCIGNETIPLLLFACIVRLAHLEVCLSLQRLLAFAVVTVELPD